MNNNDNHENDEAVIDEANLDDPDAQSIQEDPQEEEKQEIASNDESDANTQSSGSSTDAPNLRIPVRSLRSNTTIPNRPANVNDIIQNHRNQQNANVQNKIPNNNNGNVNDVNVQNPELQNNENNVDYPPLPDGGIPPQEPQAIPPQISRNVDNGARPMHGNPRSGQMHTRINHGHPNFPNNVHGYPNFPNNVFPPQPSYQVHPTNGYGTTFNPGPTGDNNQFDQLRNMVNQLQQQLNQVKITGNVKFAGLTNKEVSELIGPDNSEFYKNIGYEPTRDFSNVDRKEAEKRIRKYPKELKDGQDMVKWFDHFDFVCDELLIPYDIRYTYCVTHFFGPVIIQRMRAARTSETISNYPELKRWIFKSRNGKLRLQQAGQRVKKWKPKQGDTTIEQFHSFMDLANKYKEELAFALKWGLSDLEVNIIDEAVLFDIFMNNAGASTKLWEVFEERVTGRRSIKRAHLIAKHITHLELKISNKHGKILSINAMTKQWCLFHKTESHTTEECRDPRAKALLRSTGNQNNNGSRFGNNGNRFNRSQNRYRGNGRGGSSYRGRNFRARGAFNRNGIRNGNNGGNRKKHIPGVNCEEFKHTKDTCWSLHPEKKPRRRSRARIFALQKEIEELMNDIPGEDEMETQSEPEPVYDSSGMDGHQEKSETINILTEEEEEIQNEDEEEVESSDSELEFSFKYRCPRRAST